MTSRSASAPLIDGERLMSRLEDLSRHSETPAHVTRTYLTPAQRSAGELLIRWMQEAGMSAAFDAAGNVVGRYEGTDRGARPYMIGSHYDTVVNAGKYDGTYGVIAALSVVEALHRTGRRLRFPLEVVAFAEEEGVRFKSTLIGSRAIAGTLDPAALTLVDGNGTSLGDALETFHGAARPIGSAARRRDDLAGFIELHIEQGPVLESTGLPVGVVTAIAGASRFMIGVRGAAGHAGTVPMALRRDAAAGAAEMILAVEAVCRRNDGVVGTVGIVSTPGGAANVIPGFVELSLDVRSGSDRLREAALAEIRTVMDGIAERRKLEIDFRQTHDAGAVDCDGHLQDVLASAVAAQQLDVRRLPSGAGHDAMAMVAICPVAMLFVRCGNGGISHDPAETMTRDDARTGALVLLAALELLSQ